MYNEAKHTNNSSEPSSVGSWVGTLLLMAIPIVNIVMLCVWGFGNTADLSKKNWARAQLIFTAVELVLIVIFFTAFAGALAGSSAQTITYY